MTAYTPVAQSLGGSPSRSSSAHSQAQRSRRRKDNGFTGQASWTSSVINLVNTIVGAGVLAMPLAMSHMGIVLGCLVILWSGLTAGFGLYLQTRCARYLERGSASFFALSQITYPNAALVFDAAIAIKCFGVGVSYLIIIGDLMPGVILGFHDEPPPVLLERTFWVTVFMLAVIPLSFLRKLDSLKYTSVVALISIGYLVILVVYHFFAGVDESEKGDVRVLDWLGALPTLASFPVIVFAYTCHQNTFSVLNEIKNDSPAQTRSVVVASTGTAAAIYLIVAIFGYLTFGDSVVGNIVSQYIPSVSSTIGKAAIVVLVMFSYPLQVHPCRASVAAILRWRPGKKIALEGLNGQSSQSSSGPASHSVVHGAAPDTSETRFAAITTAIIVLSYTVAMTVSSFEKILAYVGSTGSTSISFILPGLFYYKISAPDSPQHQRLLKEDDDEDCDSEDLHGSQSELGMESATRTAWYRVRNWQKDPLRRLSLALAIYGLVVMVVCLVTNTYFIAAH